VPQYGLGNVTEAEIEGFGTAVAAWRHAAAIVNYKSYTAVKTSTGFPPPLLQIAADTIGRDRLGNLSQIQDYCQQVYAKNPDAQYLNHNFPAWQSIPMEGTLLKLFDPDAIEYV
jgi:hypothetical protein